MELKKKTAIIADDSHAHIMYMGVILKRMGFEVVPARNGVEVLKLLKLTEPDIIMLDVIMDGMDGAAVLSFIKENEQYSHIPVIMVSQDTSRQTVKRCMDLGCSAYLSKPVKVDNLHKVLQEFVFLSLGTKREHMRVTLCKKVGVTHDGVTHELYTETLSEGGMYVRKKDPIPVDSKVHVALFLDNDEPIHFDGVVIYVKGLFGGVLGHSPGMAIEFTGIGDEEKGLLRSYIQKVLAQDIFESQEEKVFDPPG